MQWVVVIQSVSTFFELLLIKLVVITNERVRNTSIPLCDICLPGILDAVISSISSIWMSIVSFSCTIFPINYAEQLFSPILWCEDFALVNKRMTSADFVTIITVWKVKFKSMSEISSLVSI